MGKESKYKLDGNDDEDDDDDDDATTTTKIRRRTLSQTLSLSVSQRLLRQNRRHGVVGRC